MKSDLVDITVHGHHEMDKAVLVSIDGERKKAVWLPHSAIEISRRRGSAVTAADVTLPERHAIEKGLV